jgi:hypothetical protein
MALVFIVTLFLRETAHETAARPEVLRATAD